MTKDPNEYNCPNCGAPIDRGRSKCAYCGTQFEWGWAPIPTTKIEVVSADVVPIRAKLAFNAEDMDRLLHGSSKEEMKKFVTEKLLDTMRPVLLANMELRTDIDIERMQHVVIGQLLIGRKR